MGKRLIQQRRGRGTSTYRAHSFHFAGKLSYNTYNKDSIVKGKIMEFIHSRGHSAPLMKVIYEDGREALMPAYEKAVVGAELEINQMETVSESDVKMGSAYLLKNIPEG
ncbi:MAG: 50S ribosomal protein L2, partial [Nanoarchaeota archaeon]|nr:50S ribosomal protein L2 [Nanoarchaeota archaeon]